VGISVVSTGVKAVGVDHQEMIENIAGGRRAQVPVAVIGQVHRRGFVGFGFVIDLQLVVVGQRVGDGDVELAGIAFFFVRGCCE